MAPVIAAAPLIGLGIAAVSAAGSMSASHDAQNDAANAAGVAKSQAAEQTQQMRDKMLRDAQNNAQIFAGGRSAALASMLGKVGNAGFGNTLLTDAQGVQPITGGGKTLLGM